MLSLDEDDLPTVKIKIYLTLQLALYDILMILHLARYVRNK